MIMTRPKIGDGSDMNPFQPDMEGIEFTGWKIIEERENEYVIEVSGYVESPDE